MAANPRAVSVLSMTRTKSRFTLNAWSANPAQKGSEGNDAEADGERPERRGTGSPVGFDGEVRYQSAEDEREGFERDDDNGDVHVSLRTSVHSRSRRSSVVSGGRSIVTSNSLSSVSEMLTDSTVIRYRDV